MEYFLKQFDQIELLEDMNPIIIKGMIGVILEVFNEGEAFEVEFVKDDGTNYEYEGQFTFAIKADQLRFYGKK